ncbi:hypothetical protein GGD66_003969 [Bradyrhizobium sp. CIR48]|uniref:hypothetical protein n=1 Tax=Bradyrhizobium sp. CIR48 TaxID=2663840 RepID=UPI00160640F0|nr:hypothetical protein [Bradyrhizobium sp. CIR48]MBB4425412.1 hypothetical protein [Bradyrhizobium sp. CIR48]
MNRRNHIKALEASEATLARLIADRARIDLQIAAIQQRREADVLQFVLDTAKRLNLTQLPATSLLKALEEVAQSARMDRPVFDPGGTGADASDDPHRELTAVFVRLTRNASLENREILGRHGLRWNGRAAGWSGRVTADALRHLREIFPGRVEGPDLERSDAHPEDEAGPTVEADRPPATSPDVQPAIMEAGIIEPAEDRPVDTKVVETGGPAMQPVVPAVTRLPASPYRLPLSRPRPPT